MVKKYIYIIVRLCTDTNAYIQVYKHENSFTSTERLLFKHNTSLTAIWILNSEYYLKRRRGVARHINSQDTSGCNNQQWPLSSPIPEYHIHASSVIFVGFYMNLGSTDFKQVHFRRLNCLSASEFFISPSIRFPHKPWIAKIFNMLKFAFFPCIIYFFLSLYFPLQFTFR